jgi:hypothetical protein
MRKDGVQSVTQSKEGYHKLLDIPSPQRSKLWLHVWQGDSLPKINSLCWVMAHEKLLTTKNIQKCGIARPSRCVLCKEDNESRHL